MGDLAIPISVLADLLGSADSDGAWLRCLHQIGELRACTPRRSPEDVLGRWPTIVAVHQHFLLLIDEFRAAEKQRFTLTLTGLPAPAGGRREQADAHAPRRPIHGPFRHDVLLAGTPGALHLLGDYPALRQGDCLTFTAHLAHGRFLLALTRDPAARVRGLNGWSVEVRSQGHVYHLLHSNRSRRLRPLGPLQTDALFALVDWPADADAGRTAQLHALHAGQVAWDGQRQLHGEGCVDVRWSGG